MTWSFQLIKHTNGNVLSPFAWNISYFISLFYFSPCGSSCYPCTSFILPILIIHHLQPGLKIKPTNKHIQICNLRSSSLSDLKHHPWSVKVVKADFISEMLAVFVRIRICPKFCDSLLECAVAVSPSAASAFRAREPSPLLRAPCRLLTGTGGIYSVSKNFQTLYLLSSWLPLVSSSPLPPTPSLILSSCVFSVGLLRRAGVALADDSVFKTSFLLKRVCSQPFPQSPPGLLVLVGAAFMCAAPLQILLWSSDDGHMKISCSKCVFI